MDLEAGFIFDEAGIAKTLTDFAQKDLSPYVRAETSWRTWLIEQVIALSSFLQKQL